LSKTTQKRGRNQKEQNKRERMLERKLDLGLPLIGKRGVRRDERGYLDRANVGDELRRVQNV